MALRDHPERVLLNDEVHARPPEDLAAPLAVTHLALLAGDGALDASPVAALCRRLGCDEPMPEASHWRADFGAFRLKWERHTEFVTYTFFFPLTGSPFADEPLPGVPADWLDGLDGERLVGLRLALLDRATRQPGTDDLRAILGADAIAGSAISSGAAAVWAPFRLFPDGFGRVLIHDRAMSERQAGRAVQRLLEIETYRMVALLAAPLARRAWPEIDAIELDLGRLVGTLAAPEENGDERALLGELTGLAARIEAIAARTSYRFAASQAYYALVERRIAELREERLPGLPMLQEFMERRLAPAMRTCEAVGRRRDAMSLRISRATELLRTRVDIALEEQNRGLLASMNRRSRLQLRLQETVEGLSVAAITYYLASQVNYLLKAVKEAGVAVPVEVGTGLSVPILLLLVWWGVRRLRRRLTRAAEGA